MKPGPLYCSCCCKKTSSTAEPGGTQEPLRIAIVTRIEPTYHRRCRQDTLGRLPPIKFDTVMTTAAGLVA